MGPGIPGQKAGAQSAHSRVEMNFSLTNAKITFPNYRDLFQPVAITRPSWKQRGPLYTEYGIQMRSVRKDQTAVVSIKKQTSLLFNCLIFCHHWSLVGSNMCTPLRGVRVSRGVSHTPTHIFGEYSPPPPPRYTYWLFLGHMTLNKCSCLHICIWCI